MPTPSVAQMICDREELVPNRMLGSDCAPVLVLRKETYVRCPF
jgi:hypothetical protein